MGDADSPVTRLLREMRRRHVFRTAALYIVGAWLVMPLLEPLMPFYDPIRNEPGFSELLTELDLADTNSSNAL